MGREPKRGWQLVWKEREKIPVRVVGVMHQHRHCEKNHNVYMAWKMVESGSRVKISDPKQALVVVCAPWSRSSQKGVALASGRQAAHTGKGMAAGDSHGKDS